MEYNVHQETHKLLDVFAQLGGLKLTITGVFGFFVLLVSKKFFENDILGSLFLVKRRREGVVGDADDCAEGDSDDGSDNAKDGADVVNDLLFKGKTFRKNLKVKTEKK